MNSQPTTGSLTDISAKPAEYYTQTRAEIARLIPPSAARVLDIGCGAGVFGQILKDERNVEVWGIELLPGVAEQARARLDHVLAGPAEACVARLPDAFFDCIVCNDVLEHLVDPYALLAALRAKMALGGVVVASIPNIRYFRTLFALVARGEWRYTESGTLDKTHLRFFTQSSIAEMFTSLGYEIVSMQGINPTASWKVAIFNTLTLGFFSDTRYLQFACVARPSARKPAATV